MATFVKRTDSKGNQRITALVRLRGLPRQSATFENMTKAKKWAQQMEVSLRDGRFFKQSESSKHTLEDLIDRYVKELEISKFSSLRQYSQMLKWWKGELGHKKLSDLSTSEIKEKQTQLRTEFTSRGRIRSPARVNRYLASLSSALSTAVKEWEWLEENPAFKVKKLREPKGRVRFLSDEERERLIEACRESENKDLLLVFLMALSTGARRMEIWGLSWKDVDLDLGTILLQDTKNKERRGLALHGVVLKMLKTKASSTPDKDGLIFPSTKKKEIPLNFRKSFQTALDQVGIKDFTWHDIRHTTASYLAMQGATSNEIAAILGHKSLDMVKRYSHISQAHSSSVLKKLNQSLF